MPAGQKVGRDERRGRPAATTAKTTYERRTAAKSPTPTRR